MKTIQCVPLTVVVLLACVSSWDNSSLYMICILFVADLSFLSKCFDGDFDMKISRYFSLSSDKPHSKNFVFSGQNSVLNNDLISYRHGICLILGPISSQLFFFAPRLDSAFLSYLELHPIQKFRWSAVFSHHVRNEAASLFLWGCVTYFTARLQFRWCWLEFVFWDCCIAIRCYKTIFWTLK